MAKTRRVLLVLAAVAAPVLGGSQAASSAPIGVSPIGVSPIGVSTAPVPVCATNRAGDLVSCPAPVRASALPASARDHDAMTTGSTGQLAALVDTRTWTSAAAIRFPARTPRSEWSSGAPTRCRIAATAAGIPSATGSRGRLQPDPCLRPRLPGRGRYPDLADDRADAAGDLTRRPPRSPTPARSPRRAITPPAATGRIRSCPSSPRPARRHGQVHVPPDQFRRFPDQAGRQRTATSPDRQDHRSSTRSPDRSPAATSATRAGRRPAALHGALRHRLQPPFATAHVNQRRGSATRPGLRVVQRHSQPVVRPGSPSPTSAPPTPR